MKRQLLSIVIILAGAAAAAAQGVEAKVDLIRKTYIDVAEKARLAETDEDQGQFGELVMNELVINKRSHQWRAIGIYQKSYKFFYKGGDTEEHLYPDQLVMAKVERKESNRTYAEVYLFDYPGRLVYYSQRSGSDDQLPADRQLYFSAAQALRIVEDNKQRDKLSAGDLKVTKDVLSSAAQIKEIFTKSIKL